jgi:hypothetical protein
LCGELYFVWRARRDSRRKVVKHLFHPCSQSEARQCEVFRKSASG